MAITLDRLALRRGITTYVSIAIPCGLIIALDGASGKQSESALWVAAAVIVVAVGPIIAGAVAGGAQRAPFVHGALAVAVPAGVFLLVRSLLGVARGDLTGTDVVSFLFYLVIVVGLGMLGGYVGFRRHQRLT